MELLWVLPAVRDTLLGRLIFVTLRMGAGNPVSRRKQFRRALGCRKELFRPVKINLSDIADMISVCRATERPPGGMGAGEMGLLCVSSTILVSQHGAGAKIFWGPAPQIIINSLKVKNLSFSVGAGIHEKTAPAPALYLIAYP